MRNDSARRGDSFAKLRTSKALLLPLLVLLSSCLGSDISQKFYEGAQRQEGLDAGTLYLWKRSPISASGVSGLLSTDNLDAIAPKTTHYFKGILNTRSPIASQDLTMHYSHANGSAPTFYRWAGRRVPWKNNPDYRVLFAYHEASKAITYMDSLISDEYVKESAAKLFAWRKAVCDDGAGGQEYGTSTCSTADDLLAAPVLPLILVADAPTMPRGEDADVTATGFCPFFNLDYEYSSDAYCVSRDDAGEWKEKWHGGRYARMVSFYRDYQFERFNFVDDGDVVIHEMAHVFQAALNPELLESTPGQNTHLDAIIEGSADFFAAAYRRDDKIFRYAQTNLYQVFPTLFSGTLTGRYRDPQSTLSFPNAYNHKSVYDTARVLSAAMNDYRKLRNGQSVSKIALSSDIAAIDNKGNAAWDIALGLLFQTFHELDPDDGDPSTLDGLSITFNSFAGKLLETCDATAGCDSAKLRLVLENRGILSTRYYVPENYDPDVVPGATNTPWAQAVTNDNDFLVKLGQSRLTNDQAEDRWGLYMPKTLGWAPFMPGGSTRFANDDNVLSPCEVVVVFPMLYNNTHDAKWATARATHLANLTFPVTGSILNFELIPEAARGVDVVDIKWWMSSGPLGFENFEHPDLGYIDAYSGVNANDIRGIPMLRPGENTQSLVSDQSSRLYKVQQEKAYDLPWSSKNVTQRSQRTRLRSAAGWIFQLPDDPADPDDANDYSAAMTFRVSFGAYNRELYVRQSVVHGVKESAGVRSLDTSFTFTQTLRVATEDAGFCDN